MTFDLGTVLIAGAFLLPITAVITARFSKGYYDSEDYTGNGCSH